MALPANWKRNVVHWASENWPYLLTAAIAAACLTVLLLAPSTAGSG